MKKFFPIRLHSSTLIEVIVSMVIITIISGMFFSFLSTLRKDQNLEAKIKAQTLIDNYSKQIFSTKTAQLSEIIIDGIVISVEQDSSQFKNIENIHIIARNSMHKVIVEKNIYISK